MPASEVFVTTEPEMTNASTYVGVTSIVVPTESGFCGNDIALLVLDTVIPASAATPVTPAVQFKMTDRSKVGTTLVTMGYGNTGPTRDDGGQRRIRRSVSVRCIPGDAQIDCPVDESESPREFITQGFACEGDSGGGAFDQASFDQAPIVLGVLSRAYDSNTTCEDATYTRTDAFTQLLIDAAKTAADQGGYPYPTWTGLQPKSPDPKPQPDPATPAQPTGEEPPQPGKSSAPTTATTTTTGCSASPIAEHGRLGAGVAFVFVACVGLRRRRQSVSRASTLTGPPPK
jgi:hypothetical protein